MQAIYESDYEDLLTTPAGDTWTCSNDQQAEWAVKRMRFAARKRDRLLAGIREEIETMQRRAEQIEQDSQGVKQGFVHGTYLQRPV